MLSIQKIAILTSGGDVPGLNACIRAIVRTAIFYNIEVLGIQRGYEGFIDGDFIPLNASSVSQIIQKGGTILSSSRSERFKTPEGRAMAYQQLKNQDIDALILIGGDGSLRGAQQMALESGIPIIGIPKTIDNDISGTDKAIGFDTATNVAMEAIDRIRDTALSHHRLFFVEVMGRHAGFIALEAGMATGAESILIPETEHDLNWLYQTIERKKDWKNSSYIVVVAEGDEAGGAYRLSEKVKSLYPDLYTGVSVLGHIQRGGSPTCFDRNLATRLGIAAVKGLLNGEKSVMVGELKGEIVFTPLQEIHSRKVNISGDTFEWLKVLSH